VKASRVGAEQRSLPAARGVAAVESSGHSRPRAWALSNGTLTTWIRADGTGSSWFKGLALSRWDVGRTGQDGAFFYLRDRERGTLWSAGHEPTRRAPDRHAVSWRPGVLRIERTDDGIATCLEACVAAEVPLEIRRLTLTNSTTRPRTIEVTSALEPVLAPAPHHRAHPAFSKLFIQTDLDSARQALVARRRPRGADERPPWMACALLGPGPLEVETDRVRFIGRGADLARPRALVQEAPLSGTTGNVLDPILCLRRTVELPPGVPLHLTWLLGAGEDRAAALSAIEAGSGPGSIEDVFRSATGQALRQMRAADLDEAGAMRAQALAAALLQDSPEWRAAPERIEALRVDPTVLSRHGIDRHVPMVLADAREAAVARQVPWLMAAQRYWRELRLPTRLVVIADDPSRGTHHTSGSAATAGERLPEGVTLLRAADLRGQDLEVLAAAARIVIDTCRKAEALELEDALAASFEDLPATVEAIATAADPAPPLEAPASGEPAPGREPLEFFNGLGGFAREGQEYVIRLERGSDLELRLPPRPWINVIANPRFGCLVSETGAGATWSGNSREHRLTPWANDPLADRHGDALYLRDEDNGRFWSPLPGPAPGRSTAGYAMAHGFGYSRCRHDRDGLEQEVSVFVAPRDPVRFVRLRVANRSTRARRLTLVSYQQLVLGGTPDESERFVITAPGDDARGLTARNPFAGDYASHVAFATFATRAPVRSTRSGDQASFLGPGGGLETPAALRRAGPLDGRVGAGLDPCFALQAGFDLAAGAELECVFVLGEGASADEARDLLARYHDPEAIEEAWQEVRAEWQGLLSTIRVETPARSLDLLINGWLLYQTLSCRMWGRTALYQSGGAFGYRDQLQDAGAVGLVRPALLREQILLHAAHQFVEGDVLHWWHPPASRGLRTRFVDDRLWLPYMTSDYIRHTGDWGVLDEVRSFLHADPLPAAEHEVYLEPVVSEQSGDLYEHCCRALDRSLERGPHGLPLFGSGDWNDGMNRVGIGGRGESVWMGFFLVEVLNRFQPLCERRSDGERAERYRAVSDELRQALDEGGWDGEWYRRGYFDDGTPLGSSTQQECRIDALAQAWAVISGATRPDRARQGMEQVERQLISERDGLIRLLTPPFQDMAEDPGYIKGYLPGVRENGGQYTHAALWVVQAMAGLGRNDRAARLLEMLSPISHSATPVQVARYQVEPYVVVADVYGEPPHVGQGGWTWYTGSSGWMFRVAVESILGVTIEGGQWLRIKPCVPDDWPAFSLDYRLPGEETRYQIRAVNPRRHARAVVGATVDGRPATVVDGAIRIPIVHDGHDHPVDVELG
jgi:cellobiose phosphorylase